MRTILFLLQKEFIQIFRNKTMLPIIFILPIVQLIILVNAATLEMKNINMVVVDNDLSSSSRKLIGKFEGSKFFIVSEFTFSIEKAKQKLLKDEADIIINIPQGFEKDLFRNEQAKLQLLINAINSTSGGLTNVYATMVIADFNKNIILENINILPQINRKNINVTPSFWYNPELNYKIYMLPGILVILITVIGMFLSSLNLVREKEMGTIEQINVTPIKKYQFIAGKLIPFWVIALFELAFGLIIGKFIFHLPILGNLFLLFGFASVYLIVMLGIGLFISTIAENQQQVLFINFFFFLIFILMSGIFTPVESMPDWAQKVNFINPLAYFMKVIRMVLLKGSTFNDIKDQFFTLLAYASIILSLAIWKYKKVA